MPSPAFYTLSLHDALPIFHPRPVDEPADLVVFRGAVVDEPLHGTRAQVAGGDLPGAGEPVRGVGEEHGRAARDALFVADRRVEDRKSTRLNSSHPSISYAVPRVLHPFPTRRSSDLPSPPGR